MPHKFQLFITKLRQLPKPQKIVLASLPFVLILGITLAIFILPHFLKNQSDVSDQSHSATKTAQPIIHYSTLSGEQIADEKLKTSPVFCVQIPNGMDGPRPQVGLHEAPIIFEAIAEAGITRFAAIFQNSKSATIGPIRSLRLYYLEWDTPFDCTVVHAGGAWDALQAVKNGYRDLTESRTYMWRDYSGYIAPNNLFTSPQLLTQFNQEHGFNNSNPTGFARIKPKQAAKIAKQNLQKSQKTEKPTPLVTNIALKFGWNPDFNVNYTYNTETNSYARAYANGSAHLSYNCPNGAMKPKQACGAPTQLAPKVVIAMLVEQHTASDGYHQDITAIGSGTAYIFQNGTAIKGTWSKASRNAQIKFQDTDGKTIALTPGQTWISAIPNHSGSVNY